ncbi:hypothetical protein GLW00_19820 [Halobacillus litoralis]|uniref:Uncharacterized protein n=1 Tax=Halobacillus litoralis TaxID=45668 RepID=A0A845FHT5_9BACI|nr:hypothetical protein [Halobacillus litoralis]MYL73067.1 hypothetical protein [Halobacillus litoralis]
MYFFILGVLVTLGTQVFQYEIKQAITSLTFVQRMAMFQGFTAGAGILLILAKKKLILAFIVKNPIIILGMSLLLLTIVLIACIFVTLV